MKYLNLWNLQNYSSFFVLNIFEKWKRWGRIDNSFLLFFCHKNLIIMDPIKIYINIKKLIFLVNTVSYNQSVCLAFFNNQSFLVNFYYNEFNLKVKNLYVILISKLFGFLSSFFFFIPRIKNLRKEKITNYARERYPSLVFLTKKCWKIYKDMFKFFLKFRIISVKSLFFNDIEFNPGYSILINECFIIYLLIKYIYLINNRFLIKD